MKKDQQSKFASFDEDSDFFKRMAMVIERNNQTLMIVKKLSRREAFGILHKGQPTANIHNNIIDTYEEESGIIYPNTNTPNGMQKLLKLHRLEQYIKPNSEEEEDSSLLFCDRMEGKFYQPETSYYKIKRKEIGSDKHIYDYYSVVFFHDITRFVRHELKLLEDTTTGVPSKKQMMPMLINYIAHAITKKESFAVTMLDIDHFKHINDTFGHQFGDEVLRELAQHVNKSIRHGEKREADTMCRFGGEEFVYTLHNIDYENSEKVNERICASIQKKFEVFAGIPLGLTCSIGTIFVDGEKIKDIDPEDKKKIGAFANKLIKEADDNMYISKNNGRNQVTIGKHFKEKNKDKDKNKEKDKDKDRDEK
jgi:diguanylate cyclase (GGDEF)-like protein